LIKALSEKALEKILFVNSDEPYAKEIAKAIHKNCHGISTTKALADTVKEALVFITSRDSREKITTSIRRTFQALRIEVNDEFSALEQFLRNLPLCLKPNGRVAILTFHSGEDNRVVKSFREGLEAGIYSDICRQPIRPTSQECFDNPRSKSAILRWAYK
jgi:16S rRNA (cytosine1402-N4)-methyltransferase